MLLGQGKIPGHTGSSRKTKKAFEQVKKLYRPKYSPKMLAYNTDHDSEPTVLSRIILVVAAIFLTIVMGLAVYKVSTWTVSAQNHQINQDKQYAYWERMAQADQYLSTGHLMKAKDYYTKALRLYPNAKAAHLGMAKTLMEQCKLKTAFCEQAQAYKHFLDEQQFIDSIDVDL